VPAQIANGVVSPAVAPAGTKVAAALGEVEREGVAAKAGVTAKTGAAAKVGAGKAATAVAPVAQANTVAAQGLGTKAATVGKVSVGTKIAGGTIWTGKGLGLGLGLGLGVWGPVILGVVGAGAVYAYMKSRDIEAAQSDEEVELRDALV